MICNIIIRDDSNKWPVTTHTGIGKQPWNGKLIFLQRNSKRPIATRMSTAFFADKKFGDHGPLCSSYIWYGAGPSRTNDLVPHSLRYTCHPGIRIIWIIVCDLHVGIPKRIFVVFISKYVVIHIDMVGCTLEDEICLQCFGFFFPHSIDQALLRLLAIIPSRQVVRITVSVRELESKVDVL